MCKLFFDCATSDGLRPSLSPKWYPKRRFEYHFFHPFFLGNSKIFSDENLISSTEFFFFFYFFPQTFSGFFFSRARKNLRADENFPEIHFFRKKVISRRKKPDFLEIRKNPYEGLGLDIILTSETGQKWGFFTGIV